MTVALIALGLGYVGGFWRGAIFGRHHARGLRSWRDIVANTKSSRGLSKKLVREWRLALGELLLTGLVLAGLVGALLLRR